MIASSCTNTASTSATIDDGTTSQESGITQEVDQNNLCIKDSSCSNTGTVTDTSGSNSQSNTCIDISTCNNTGSNDKTVCVKSAICENIGTDTKVISKGQDCSSGDPGTTTVCVNGHTTTS